LSTEKSVLKPRQFVVGAIAQRDHETKRAVVDEVDHVRVGVLKSIDGLQPIESVTDDLATAMAAVPAVPVVNSIVLAVD
jgi:hypothetical protein